MSRFSTRRVFKLVTAFSRELRRPCGEYNLHPASTRPKLRRLSRGGIQAARSPEPTHLKPVRPAATVPAPSQFETALCSAFPATAKRLQIPRFQVGLQSPAGILQEATRTPHLRVLTNLSHVDTLQSKF